MHFKSTGTRQARSCKTMTFSFERANYFQGWAFALSERAIAKLSGVTLRENEWQEPANEPNKPAHLVSG